MFNKNLLIRDTLRGGKGAGLDDLANLSRNPYFNMEQEAPRARRKPSSKLLNMKFSDFVGSSGNSGSMAQRKLAQEATRFTFSDKLPTNMPKVSSGAHTLFPGQPSSEIRNYRSRTTARMPARFRPPSGAGRVLGAAGKFAGPAGAVLTAAEVTMAGAEAARSFGDRAKEVSRSGKQDLAAMVLAQGRRQAGKQFLSAEESKEYNALLGQQQRTIALSGRQFVDGRGKGFFTGGDFAGEGLNAGQQAFLDKGYDRRRLGELTTKLRESRAKAQAAAAEKERQRRARITLDYQNRNQPGERMSVDADGNLFLPSARREFEKNQQKEAEEISRGIQLDRERKERQEREAASQRAQDQLARSRAARANFQDPSQYGMGTLSSSRPDLMNPATARRESDRLRDEALRRGGFAGGYVPNFQGINDAVRREIRDGGVSRNQVRVHLNPDAVTNTRDEPRGLKDVPNFAASEEVKRMASTLGDIFTEISALREESNKGGSSEEGSTTESTVRHINSPLSINVSGNIQESNSNIDKQIFDAVVKAVEKLRGGVPVSPPKAQTGEL